MKIMSRLLLPATLVAILFMSAGCQKLSDEELLTSHTWKWDKMTTNSDNESIQTIVALSNALMTGGVFEFRENGTYNLTVSSFNYSEDGTWELIGKDILMMDDDEMSILKFNKEELVLDGEETDDEFGTYTVTMYLKK
jgi:hypothetical protein